MSTDIIKMKELDGFNDRDHFGCRDISAMRFCGPINANGLGRSDICLNVTIKERGEFHTVYLTGNQAVDFAEAILEAMKQ